MLRMNGPSAREVLYSLKISADPSNVQAERAADTMFQRMERQSLTAGRRARKAYADGWTNFANALGVAAEGSTRQWNNFAKGLEVAAKQSAIQSEQAAKESTRHWNNFATGLGVAVEQTNAQWVNFARGLEVAAKGTEKQEKAALRLERQLMRLDRQADAAGNRIWASSRQALGGIESMTRGMVLLGVSSEKDMTKVVQAIARFEGLVAIIRGPLELIEAFTKARKAYAAATLAAAQAEALLGSAQVATAAKGTAAGVGGAVAGAGRLGGALRYAGVGIGGAAAGAGLAGAFPTAAGIGGGAGAAALAYGGPAILAVGAFAAIMATFNKDFREGLFELLGITDQAADAARQWQRKMERLSQEADDGAARGAILQFESQQSIALAGRRRAFQGTAGMLGPRLGAAALQFELSSAQNEYGAARLQSARAFNPNSGMSMLELQRVRGQAIEREQGALERVIDLEQQRLGVVRQQAESRLASHQQSIESLREEMRLAKEGLKTDAQRIAELSPFQQQRAAALGSRLSGGQQLTASELQEASGFGLHGLDQLIRQQQEALGRQTDLFRQVIEPLSRLREQKLQLKIDGEQKIVVKLEQDFEKAGKELAQKLEPAFRRLGLLLAQEVERQFADQANKEFLRQANADAAGQE